MNRCNTEMNMPPQTQPAEPRHFRAEVRLMARAFFPPFGATVVLFGLAYALIIAFGESDPDAPSKAILTVVAFGYGAFVGLWPAMLVGGIRLSWTLVGAWTLVPLLAIPAAIAVALWLSSGLLADLAHDIVQAVAQASEEREWLAEKIGRAAHVGPVILVFLLPLLLIDLGALALDPAVLWAMFVLLLAFAGIVAAAVLPTGLFCLVVLLRAYLVRLRQRIEARKAAAT